MMRKVLFGAAALLVGLTLLVVPAQADPEYDPACDIDRNGEINIVDIMRVAALWQETSTWSCSCEEGSCWSLTGNDAADPATNFLGTTDAVSLTLVVSNTAALRLEPNATSPNLIGGYSGNSVATGTAGATIGGGGSISYTNRVTDDYGTVGGGYNNQAGNGVGTTSDAWYATVSGGGVNTASAGRATVAGGWGNTASDTFATVSGGRGNTASHQYTTVGGGYDNEASNWYATVGGGVFNTASGPESAVGGGKGNTASGFRATVPGGWDNEAAGDQSFAAGRRAKANNDGCFVWGDSTDADVACNDNDRWIARASGGVYFYTNAGLTSGMYLSAGGSAWNAVSNRERKENFVSVDAQALVARLAEVPITTWNYKSQDDAIRHIGPMAEDFNTLIEDLGGEGEDYINTLDADGVALAAIQGLHQLSQEQAVRIEVLEAKDTDQQAQIDALQLENADLIGRVAALEQAVGTSRPSQSRRPGGWLLVGSLAMLWWGVRREQGKDDTRAV